MMFHSVADRFGYKDGLEEFAMFYRLVTGKSIKNKINFSRANMIRELNNPTVNRFQIMHELGREFPELDFDTIKRNVIYCHEANPVVADALSGQKTLRESLDELVGDKKKRYLLPSPKNSAHENRAQMMSYIVGNARGLHRKGIFYPNNILTNFAYFNLGLIGYNLLMPEINNVLVKTAVDSVVLGTLFMATLNLNRKIIPDKLYARAEYIDDYIAEVLK